MKKIFITLIMISLICISLNACKTNEPEIPQITAEAPTAEADPNVQTEVKYIYKVKYKNVEFISKEEKTKWREYLVRLIENESKEVCNGDDVIGYVYPYPDRPGIRRGYDLGLFDLNVDGIPELLVNLGGGSAGNAYYEVFDITDGTFLGTLDGGFDNDWCIYFNSRTGEYESIGQFQWRFGWMRRIRMISKATVTSTPGGTLDVVSERMYFCTAYEIYDINGIPTDEQKELGRDSMWQEIYPSVEFDLYGIPVSLDEYFEEYDTFIENYVRIPETGLKLIDRYDYETPEQIVDALLSTSQEFITDKD